MSRRRKIAVIVGCIPLLVVLAGVSLFLFYNWMAIREAERLLVEVRALKLGESTNADVGHIMQGFEYWQGKLPYGNSCRFFPIADGSFVRGCDVLLNPFGYRFGRHFRAVSDRLQISPWWAVRAQFSERQGRVTSVSYSVYASEKYHPSQVVGAEAIHSVRSNEPDRPNYSVRLSESQKGYHSIGLSASATEEAAPEERARMFNFDFSCLKWLGWCRTPCEIMPAAWNDYLAIRRNEGRPLSPEDLDRYCPTGH